MKGNISRVSIGSTASRLTDTLNRTEKTRLETKLQDAQSELYQMRRIMPFLESADPDNPSITLRTIASECADLREERDRLRKELDKLESSKQEELQRTDELISELQRQLQKSQEKCSIYKKRCEEYEREQSEEESRLYRQEIDSRTQLVSSQSHKSESSSGKRQDQNRRVKFQIDQHAAKDPTMRNLFNRMDETDSYAPSIASCNSRQGLNFNHEANFTATDPPKKSDDVMNLSTAANVNEYVNVLKDYRTNVRTLYDQMKSTAHFFVDVFKRLGYENDPQIQLMMDKINQLNLNMQNSKNLSKKVLEETKQLGNGLAALYRSFEKSELSPNNSNNSNGSKSDDREKFETALREKDELVVQLRNEKDALDTECQKLQADCNEFKHLASELEQRIQLCKEKEDELVEELGNRKKIIETLAEQIRQEVHEKEIQMSELKRRVKVAVSNSKDVHSKLAIKIHDGAKKSGYVLSDELAYH